MNNFIQVENIDDWWSRVELDSRFINYYVDLDTGNSKSNVPIIYDFHGDNYFLSNFYPFLIKCWGIDFPTTEHAFQWAKCGGRLEWGEKIRLAETPGQAKKLGRKCPIRPDWDEIKFEVMKEVLIEKFKRTSLWPKLDGTGNSYLIESNVWHDCVWGICIKKDCERGCGQKKGYNNLGLLLMELRAILKGKINLSLVEDSLDGYPKKECWVKKYENLI